MKRILFPTDFSPGSLAAFDYALELADTLGAEILCLHVYELAVLDYDGAPPYLLETYAAFDLRQFENFRDQVPLLRERAMQAGKDQVVLHHLLLQGELVDNIRQTIQKEAVDLVVMGTKGASGFDEVFLGTTTVRVLGSTDVPVLAIPHGAEFRSIRNIGFTTRFKDEERNALKTVVGLAQTLGASVQVLHVDTEEEKASEVVIADWELVFRGQATFHIREQNDLEQAIFDFTVTQQIDILAMLHHRRGFFEGLFHRSRTKQLAYHTKVPLLALH